ncbi:uncharacterized protein LOC113511501 [Galleria mellonella]|uniref:Uncharacterized protein LOC113511501 n=1 Tax=Galleria mellonella TaxID=7137 RepID=A0ABM3MIN9_GALME|nr:uncharacterized protein LOC113511501 [Galleria mellonella]
MLYLLFVSVTLSNLLKAVYLFDYYEPTSERVNEEMVFEPVLTLTKNKEETMSLKNINCENFTNYALNCTVQAALLYNSSRKTPPMPAKIGDWCRAIRHLTNCAIDWNADCKDVTESHFNEESIKGHMHVVDSVCDDEWFLSRYDELPICIEATADVWESCYTTFKILVDELKNTTHEWTHFETHFYLCCARAQFRRCTLDSIFEIPTICTHEQAVTLQKFSVIVSEGDVFQDCDRNMMYKNCPGGDPRPNHSQLSKLMNVEFTNTANIFVPNHIVIVIFIVFFEY